jgi:hypothetical protein
LKKQELNLRPSCFNQDALTEVTLCYDTSKKNNERVKKRKEFFCSAIQTLLFAAGVEPAHLVRYLVKISPAASAEVFLFYDIFQKVMKGRMV